MATFAISFRIANDIGYSERWSSTVAAIHREATGGSYWEETTSFVILQSDKTADSLASSIYIGSSFDGSKDTLLVINTGNQTYATRGKVDYPNTLNSLFAKYTLANILAR